MLTRKDDPTEEEEEDPLASWFAVAGRLIDAASLWVSHHQTPLIVVDDIRAVISTVRPASGHESGIRQGGTSFFLPYCKELVWKRERLNLLWSSEML